MTTTTENYLLTNLTAKKRALRRWKQQNQYRLFDQTRMAEYAAECRCVDLSEKRGRLWLRRVLHFRSLYN